MYRLTILLSCLFLSSLFPVSGQTETIYVSGDVWGTWTADSVIVVSEIRIPPGYYLMIMPGVNVLFMNNCQFIVQPGAVLQATGLPDNRIRFDQYSVGIHWGGIRFLTALGDNRLEYCDLIQSRATGSSPDNNGGAIYCSYSSPQISNCWFNLNEATGDGGAIYLENSNAAIYNCSIENSYAGDDGGAIYCTNSSPNISNCLIQYNEANDWCGGIVCENSSGAVIIGNTIMNNTSNDDGGAIICSGGSNVNIIDNEILSNWTGDYGGAVYINNSSPNIRDNVISGNHASDDGGAIAVVGGGIPTIENNIISYNESLQNGGAIYCIVDPIITDNYIVGNTATSSGGGIYCSASTCTFVRNIIQENIAGNSSYGGGIYVSSSDHTITDNIIDSNVAGYGGGLYFNGGAYSLFVRNTVTCNFAYYEGGGMYLYNLSTNSTKSTIFNNTAGSTGGGIYCQNCSPSLSNFIIRGNSPQQVYGSPTITYTNIEWGWWGVGNIDADPEFVAIAQPDCRLHWGSPCIDAGDPASPWDPDGTIADMGAHFYNQDIPIRIVITPYDAPIRVSTGGGTFNFLVTVSNCTDSWLPATVYTDILTPTNFLYGPVIGPVDLVFAPNSNVYRIRSETTPPDVPPGYYYYNAYAVSNADTCMDNFLFEKMGLAGGDVGGGSMAGWQSSGEDFNDLLAEDVVREIPMEYGLFPNYPNPFNPRTTLHFNLPEAAEVSLCIYDLTGRQVAEVIDGWRDAGYHEAAFDASGLSSGVYIYRIRANNYEASGKMTLMK